MWEEEYRFWLFHRLGTTSVDGIEFMLVAGVGIWITKIAQQKAK